MPPVIFGWRPYDASLPLSNANIPEADVCKWVQDVFILMFAEVLFVHASLSSTGDFCLS